MRLGSLTWILTMILLVSVKRTSTSTMSQEARDEVESSLLTLLGFSSRPKVDRSKVVIPKAMMDLYYKQTGQLLNTATIPKRGLHTNSANTVRSFAHAESPIDSRFPGHHKFRLKFDVATVPRKEKLQAAEIALNREVIDWVAEGDQTNRHLQQILVHDIVKPGIKGRRGAITRLIDSKTINTRINGSVSLDVLPAVQRWLDNPSTNFGILISVVGFGANRTSPGRHVRLKRDLAETEEDWEKKQPLLFTYTDDGKNRAVYGEELAKNHRFRRAMNKKHRKKSHRETCQRHTMYVDFNEVGWNDWIVAPPGYDAFYCYGECNFPMAEHLNTTNHAIVQTLVNSVSPTKVPKACCVPTQLNSISMLYVDEGNKVVLKNYKEMTVVGCGCR